MSKKILTILILILIFGTNNVFALDLTTGGVFTNTSGWTRLSSQNLTYYQYDGLNGRQSINYEFQSVGTNWANYDYFYMIANIYLTNNKVLYEDISLNNINFDMTCNTNNTSYYDNNAGTIYYQDGSHADIDITLWQKYCNTWELSQSAIANGQVSSTTIDLSPSMNIAIEYTNTGKTFCKQYGNMYECPIRKDLTPKGFYIELVNKGFVSNYRISINNNMYWTKDGDAQIIQSINTQNQQQHTDNQNTQQKIDDIKNSITDSNVNGNNSNDTISSIGGTFDTENDFLLGLLTIPYTFWNSITNVFSNSCSALNVGTMFDKPLIFPCIELSDYLGNVFTSIIDVIFAGIIMSAFVRRIIRYYQALLSLDNSATFIGGVKVW